MTTTTLSGSDTRPRLVDNATADKIGELIGSVYGYELGDPDGVYVVDAGDLLTTAPAIYWERSDDWTVDAEVLDLIAREVPDVQVRRVSRTTLALHWKP